MMNEPVGIDNTKTKYLNVYVLVIALILVALTSIEIFEIAELPYEKYFANIGVGSVFSGLLSVISDSNYAGIFVLMTLESMFVPIPSEVILPLSGYLVYTGSLNFTLVFIDAIGASMAGAFIDYYLALYFGRPAIVKMLHYFAVRESSLTKAEMWIDGKGSISVFLARFIPGIRGLISIPAGALRMKLKIFIVMTFAGSFIWSFALIYLGYAAGPLWNQSIKHLSVLLDQAIIYGLFAAGLVYIGYYVYFKIAVKNKQI